MRKSHHIIFISAIFIFMNVQNLSASLNKRSHDEISDCVPDDDRNKKRKLLFRVGDMYLQYNLACQLENGRDMAQDPVEAAKLYHGAAKYGHIDAMYRLAHIYHNGQGVIKDLDKAIYWHHKAAKAGHELAKRTFKDRQYDIAYQFETGRGIMQDLVGAAKLYRGAAKEGHQDAMYRLANMYNIGQGIAQDSDVAIHLYTKAKRSGHKLSKHTLNKIRGESFFKDKIELVKYYKNLANQGDENAKQIFCNFFTSFPNKSQPSDDSLDAYFKDQMCTLQENISIFLGLHDMGKGDNDPTSKFKKTSDNKLLFPLYSDAVNFEQDCFDMLNELTKDNLHYECGFMIDCLQPKNQMRIFLKETNTNNSIKLYTIGFLDYVCFGSSNIKIANQLVTLINAEDSHRLQSVNKLKDHYVKELNLSTDEQKLELEEKIKEFDAVLALPSQIKQIFVRMTYHRNKIFLENNHFLKEYK